MTKNWEKITAEMKYIFSGSKIAIYLSLGLHKGRPSYRRSLHPSKENIWHFKTGIFFTFEGHLGPPGSRSGSCPMRIQIRIQPTKMNADPCGSRSATMGKM
jgi:hypothetical protein